MFENIKDNFLKFYWGKILGKKYIRSGSCKSCGNCCQKIYVRHADNVIKNLDMFEKLKNTHFFYSYLKVVEEDEIGLVFECKNLDKEKGTCKDYSRRATICRTYPQEEIFMMGGTITKNCGFKFTPIKSFEEVLEKVSLKNCNKAD